MVLKRPRSSQTAVITVYCAEHISNNINAGGINGRDQRVLRCLAAQYLAASSVLILLHALQQAAATTTAPTQIAISATAAATAICWCRGIGLTMRSISIVEPQFRAELFNRQLSDCCLCCPQKNRLVRWHRQTAAAFSSHISIGVYKHMRSQASSNYCLRTNIEHQHQHNNLYDSVIFPYKFAFIAAVDDASASV